MKSIIDFERIVIDDNTLDEAGLNIMEKMIIVLSKLSTYEVCAGPSRDIQLSIDLADIIEKCQALQKSYKENTNEST